VAAKLWPASLMSAAGATDPGYNGVTAVLISSTR
jgi:hypothetical protein